MSPSDSTGFPGRPTGSPSTAIRSLTDSLAPFVEQITTEMMGLWYDKAHLPYTEIQHLREAIPPLVQVNGLYGGMSLREKLHQKMDRGQPVSVRLATVSALRLAGGQPALRGSLFWTVLLALDDPAPEVCQIAAGILALWRLPAAAAARAFPVLITQFHSFTDKSQSLPLRFQAPPDAPDRLLDYLVDMRINEPTAFACAILILALERVLVSARHTEAETLLAETVWRTPIWIVGALAGEVLRRMNSNRSEELDTILVVARSRAASETRGLARRLLTRIGATTPRAKAEEEWGTLVDSNDMSSAAEAAVAIGLSMAGCGEEIIQGRSWIVRQLLRQVRPLQGRSIADSLQDILSRDVQPLSWYTEKNKKKELASPLEDDGQTRIRSRYCEVSAFALFLESGTTTVQPRQRSNTAEQTFAAFRNSAAYDELSGHVYAQSDDDGLTLYGETLEVMLECAITLAGIIQGQAQVGGMQRMGIHVGRLVLESPSLGVWRVHETFSAVSRAMARHGTLRQILLTEAAVRDLPAQSPWRDLLTPTGTLSVGQYDRATLGKIAVYNLYDPIRGVGAPVFRTPKGQVGSTPLRGSS